MKKLVIGLYLVFSFFLSNVYAGGGMTHMYIAEQAIAKIPDAKLRNLLLDNMDAYLVGAYYPDSGFVQGNHYGEDSHWEPFMNAFIEHLQSKYTDPVVENPRLVAFLLGCAVHNRSDVVIHWTFYPEARQHDFNGDGYMVHHYGDFGIDLFLNLDKNLWLTHPLTWWVPVSDLVDVYHRMGKDEYNADEIIRGNVATALAGYGERLITLPIYPYLRWKMPWMATHYYDAPQGGVLMDEDEVATYEMQIWDQLNSRLVSSLKISKTRSEPSRQMSTDGAYALEFANEVMETGALTANVTKNRDGSVTIGEPIENDANKLKDLVTRFIAKLTSGI